MFHRCRRRSEWRSVVMTFLHHIVALNKASCHYCSFITHFQSPSSQRLRHSPIFAVLRRRRSHQPIQAQIPPSGLLHFLRRPLDAESCMLVGHDIVFVVGIDRLVLWWNVDFLGG